MNSKDIYDISNIKFVPLSEQPDNSIEFYSEDGVFVKVMAVKNEGTFIPTHEHGHSHMSMVCNGAIRAWCDGKYIGDYKAPMAVHIKARSKHTFLTLEPNTVVHCIHRLNENGEVEVLSEHKLGGE